MKTTIKIFAILIIMLFTYSCDKRGHAIRYTKAYIQGAWKGDFPDSICQKVLITFNDDGTGTLTYLRADGSLVIDPPCSILWELAVYKTNDILGGKMTHTYLSITRLETGCAGCMEVVGSVPDIKAYHIVYRRSDTLKLSSDIAGGLTVAGIFGTEGREDNTVILLRQK